MDLTEIPGIGEKTAAALTKAGITTLTELLETYPRTYRSYQATTASEGRVGEWIVLKGQLTRPLSRHTNKVTTQLCSFEDHTGNLTLRWFNMPYLIRSIKPQATYFVRGKLEEFRGVKQLVTPQLTIVSDDTPLKDQLVPIYSQKGSLKPWVFRSKLAKILQEVTLPPDPLPPSVISNYSLISYQEALNSIHQPSSNTQLEAAIYRLSFQELYTLQLDTLKNKHQRRQTTKAFKDSPQAFEVFTNSLPFALTHSQTQAIKELSHDLTSTTNMHRLLAGEVGSGKTVVAAYSAYLAAQNHSQTLVMAPTVILAKQLYDSLENFLSPLNLSVSLVTANHKGSLEAQVIVGTQALLTQALPEIGLLIIDEQHRFGVNQRQTLSKLAAHTLLMTATPIPRSLAQTLLGYLDITRLTELPQGRKPVKTYLVPAGKREDSYLFLRQEIDKGKQVFMVTPLIEEAEESDTTPLKSVNSLKKDLAFRFPSLTIDYLHGKMKESEKLARLQDFRLGNTKIMVATSMIEVGIDIPTANLMVIEDADRFGLAQLHQLRGRVGRGGEQGYCLLFTSSNTQKVKERLAYFVRTNDGEKLALYDLQDRGPGELFGVEQHGFFNLKLASIYDHNLLKATYQAAQSTLAKNNKI